MEALAEAAGVSKPVLYQHFPSKRALYLALVRDAVELLQTMVGAALEGTTDNASRVQGAITAFFDFVEDERFRLLFLTADTTDPEVAEVLEAGRANVARHVAKLIASDAGLDEPAAELLAHGLRGLAIDGARWWVEQDRVPKEEASAFLARLAWRGVGSFTRD